MKTKKIILLAIGLLLTASVFSQDLGQAGQEFRNQINSGKPIVTYICYIALLITGANLIFSFTDANRNTKNAVVIFLFAFVSWAVLKAIFNLPAY